MSDLFACNICNGFLKRFFNSLPQHSHWLSLWPSERFWKMLWSYKLCYRLKLSPRQHDHCPAILQVPRTQNKLYEPHSGNTKGLWGINEPHLGNEKPLTKIIQPHLGIVYEMNLAEDTCISLHKWKHLSLDKHVRKLWRFYTEERNLELVFFTISTI